MNRRLALYLTESIRYFGNLANRGESVDLHPNQDSQATQVKN
jgi:hypothetical protein